MVFNKGVADSGSWGNKFFGRIMIQESQIGAGCLHKVWRAKVIYGLEPVFESGNTCIIKARNHIAYGGKGEGCLADRNLEVIKQVRRLFCLSIRCAIPASQWVEPLFTVFIGAYRSVKFRTWLVNTAKSSPQKRESLRTLAPLLSKYHHKVDSFIEACFAVDGPLSFAVGWFTTWQSLFHRVVPLYLMYRPANTVPYATVEADLTGVYQRYSVLDHTGRMDTRTGSDVEQKCCALQHWIYLWTSGNMLLTRLEGIHTISDWMT